MLVQVKYGKHIQGEVIDFTMQECGGCGIPFFAPTKWLNDKKETNGSFSCPNGCSRVFVGETEAEKLKKQLEQQKKEADNNQQFLTNRLLDTINEKTKLEKQLKRVHNGVCPCCKRSFKDLNRHMKTKHPEEIEKMP